jgi:hypothetical protein
MPDGLDNVGDVFVKLLWAHGKRQKIENYSGYYVTRFVDITPPRVGVFFRCKRMLLRKNI